MSTVLFLLVLAGLVTTLAVRYRVTTKYSRLPRELDDDEKDDQALVAEMWDEPTDDMDDGGEFDKCAPTSHFDEFLKAIKVFGFLEHDVFNELTKSMQTLRIQKGESVRLKNLGGFTVVINGAVEVYCKSDDSPESSRYDQLNKITASTPISSLSSILSLFSEDIIESEDDEDASTLSDFDRVNATVVAVASEPSTIVVIPAHAFKGLTRKFPSATASIVQVILFRWSQVTFRTCQRYLNLTQQFYGTEQILNARAAARPPSSRPALPKWLGDRVVKQIKLLASQAPESQGSVVLEPRLSKTRANSATLEDVQASHNIELIGDDRRLSSEFPGDLISHAPLSFHSTIRSLGSQSISNLVELKGSASAPRHLIDKDSDDAAARRSIVEVIFSILRSDSRVSRGKTPPRDADAEGEDSEAARRLDGFEVYPASSFGLDVDLEDIDDSSNSESENKEAGPPPEPARTPTYSELLDDACGMLELMWYRKGEYISRYGERSRGLLYVMDGIIEVSYQSSSAEQSPGAAHEHMFDVGPGQVTGFLETISSNSSFVDLVAKEDLCVAVLSKANFERLADVYPLLYITAAKALTTSLTRPIVQLDFALEWISIKSGRRLLTEGTPADAIFFVLNGRMRAYEKRKLVGDFGHGSTIGELETMSGENYSYTIIAARDTELSRFPRTLVTSLAREYPSITFEMSRMVVQAMRARETLSQEATRFSDFKTVALLPTSAGIPVEEFAVKLSSAFDNIGRSVKVLTSAVILRYLGKYAFHRMGALRLKAYLADLEDQYDILLYVGDGSTSSQWSRTCIDQADCVLLLADGASQPVFSEVERMVVRSPIRSRTHLILLHNEQQVTHGSTAKWLNHRPWISAHHHIQMDFIREDSSSSNGNAKGRVQKKITEIKNRVQDEIKFLQQRKLLLRRQKVQFQSTSRKQYKNDFNRLARVLAGEAVAIVLGGGGARGLSHIGVLQALEEAGVPIDMVGGTSIGALIGGLYAREYDMMPLLSRAKLFSVRVSAAWRVLLDVTYPRTAWTTGHAFNRAVWKVFGNSRIEDFWVKYFTNTTNLTHSCMEVHERGYAWRYIRASMSLAGLVPPIEEKGQMLLDGGYVDNLPVSEMKKMGARYIIAVDVGAVDDTTPLNYGDSLSGFWALINKYNPFSTTPNVPDIAEIQQRLTYVSSVKALEAAKVAAGVIYLRPPIDNYATLEFSKFDEIREVGFKYASESLCSRINKGEIPTVYHVKDVRDVAGSNPQQVRFRRNSF